MEIYKDGNSPGVLFENDSFMWFNQRYMLYIELNADYFGKIIVGGLMCAPTQFMEQDDPRIPVEFRNVIEYLGLHANVREALCRLEGIDVDRIQGYPLEAITEINQISGPVHVDAISFAGNTTRDILTLEWKPSDEATLV